MEDIYMLKTLFLKKTDRVVFDRGFNFNEVMKGFYDPDSKSKGYMEYINYSFDCNPKFKIRKVLQDEAFTRIQNKFQTSKENI